MGRDGPIGLFGLLFRQEVDNENTPETGGGTNWLRLTEIPKKNWNILLKNCQLYESGSIICT